MAFAAATVWNVSSSGLDTNGGGFVPGTAGTFDYSQQTLSQASGTVSSSGTTVTATTSIFTSLMVNNYITDGTTWKQITAYTNGTTITVDSAPSWSSATIRIGGALATPGKAAGLIVTGNTVYVSGTFTCSTSSNVAGGRIAPAVASQWYGYTNIYGDGGQATLNAGANSMTVVTVGAYSVAFQNFTVAANSYTSVTAFAGGTYYYRCIGCAANAVATGWTGTYATLVCCEGINVTSIGIDAGGSFSFCRMTGCATGAYTPTAAATFVDCVFDTCATGGSESAGAAWINCGFYKCSSGGLVTSGNANSIVINCWSYNPGATNGDFFTNSSALNQLLNCAYRSGKIYNTPAANVSPIIISADPTVNGSGGNFALNSTAGGGALLRAAGYQSLSGGTVGYPAVGPVQPLAGGILVNPGMSGGTRG